MVGSAGVNDARKAVQDYDAVSVGQIIEIASDPKKYKAVNDKLTKLLKGLKDHIAVIGKVDEINYLHGEAEKNYAGSTAAVSAANTEAGTIMKAAHATIVEERKEFRAAGVAAGLKMKARESKVTAESDRLENWSSALTAQAKKQDKRQVRLDDELAITKTLQAELRENQRIISAM